MLFCQYLIVFDGSLAMVVWSLRLHIGQVCPGSVREVVDLIDLLVGPSVGQSVVSCVSPSLIFLVHLSIGLLVGPLVCWLACQLVCLSECWSVPLLVSCSFCT